MLRCRARAIKLTALLFLLVCAGSAERTVVLDTSDVNHGNSPDLKNVFTFGGGAAEWASLIPANRGYMSDIRTGNPGSTGTATVKQTAVGQGDYLVSVSFQFQYIIGFCTAGNPRCLPQDKNPSVALTLEPDWRNKTNDAVKVFQGKPVTDGPFGNGTYLNYNECRHVNPGPQCYSPPVKVNVNYINLLQPKGGTLRATFSFDNHERNLQLAFQDGVGLLLTLHYAEKPAKNPKAAEGVFILGAATGVFALYCAVGVLYLKKAKGESGRDMIPNNDFWTGLPGLVKDGCGFTLKKFLGFKIAWHTAQTYEEL